MKALADRLRRAGIEHADWEAEELLARSAGMSRKAWWEAQARGEEPALSAALEADVVRRERREPLQYILREWAFWGLALEVSPEALIPRPETEALFGRALALCRGRRTAAPRVLDWGTGTGCLAIAWAAEWPGSEVHALECSPEALALARRNARRHGVEGRISWWRGNGPSALPSGVRFDVLLANPPYVPGPELAWLAPELAHEPRLALDGGPDGHGLTRRIARAARDLLAPRGFLALEEYAGTPVLLEAA